MVQPADAVRVARRQSIGGMLSRTARRYPDKLAIICGEASWTYRQFDEIVDQLAKGFRSRGLSAGDRVAILSRNSHAFAAVRFAAARSGVVLVPVNFMLNEREVEFVLRHSGARWLFVDEGLKMTGSAAASACGTVEHIFGLPSELGKAPDCFENFEQLREAGGARFADECGDNSLAQIIYTSGTESLPKGVLLTHSAILWQYQSCIAALDIMAGDSFLHALPMFHCAQLDTFLGPCIAVGATNFITGDPHPDKLISHLVSSGATSFFAPPTVWIGLLATGKLAEAAAGTLVKAYYGASIMPLEVLNRLRSELPSIKFWNCYGQSEMAPLATVLSPTDHDTHLGSVGRPVLNVTTRIVDENGQDVAVGDVGEIVHRSPQLMLGYHNDSDKTAEAFQGGWFHSGDLAVSDADGFITIVDRKKDMIKSGGENISSSEVENCLQSHPAVLEAAVIAIPDQKWVEAVAAIVVLRPGLESSSAELTGHCSDNLARFKVPKMIRFVDELPKSPSGKVLKRELRSSFSQK